MCKFATVMGAISDWTLEYLLDEDRLGENRTILVEGTQIAESMSVLEIWKFIKKHKNFR